METMPNPMPTVTDDLRALARTAFWPVIEAAFPDMSMRDHLGTPVLAAMNRGLYAVLAAVLPAHRRQVLDEAAHEVEQICDGIHQTGDQ